MRQFIARSMHRVGNAFGDGTAKEDQPKIHNQTGNLDPGTDPLAHMRIGSKWSYSTLEYPLDIQTRSDLGHYMMFYVNVIDSNRSGYSTYASGAGQKKTRATMTHDAQGQMPEAKKTLSGPQQALREEQEYSTGKGKGGSPATSEFNAGGAWMPGSKPKVVQREHYQGRLSKQLSDDHKRTVRTSDSVVLYMPSTIQTNTNAVYKSTEMGNLGMTALGHGGDIFSKAQSIGYYEAIMEAVPNLVQTGLVDVQRALAKGLGAIIGGDVAGGVDKLSNRAQNRFLESLFDAVGFRKFSYTFKFTPKTVEESFVAKNIIKLFRFHMSPELPDDDLGRYFIPPAEFDLFYMYRDEQNDFLNKISSCVLVNMDVNYANGRFQTFRPVHTANVHGAPPTEIEMKMDFMETRIITKLSLIHI